jgi:uncharacterized membrane protein YqhA
MNLENTTDRESLWLVGIHGVFVVTGVLLALTDRLSGEAGKH